MLGHLVCPVETQRKVLESDIFRILEFEGVTETGTLYKISPSKFVLVFESKVVMEKLQGTEIQCPFGDSEVCLNFRKRIGPLRNRKEPIFVTILLPEFISDQTVRLAFSNFGEVISVFKARRNFNRFIRNWKRYVRIFPTGGDPAISINYPAMSNKFLSMAISKGMSFSRKRWCCATGAKLVTCLARTVLLSHPLKKIPACLSPWSYNTKQE